MSRIKGTVALATSAAMVVAMTSIIAPVPAAAVPPDPGIQQLVSFLDGPTNSLQSWSKALGTIGKLADALPAVQTSPGSALGFNDLLDKAFHAGTKKLSDAIHDADLNISEPIDLGDGRTGTLVATIGGSGDKTLSVDVSLDRDVVNQPLNVSLPIGAGSNAPQSAFSSTGGVTVHVKAQLKFDLVWDSASNTVYLKVNNSGGTQTPALTVDATAALADTTAVKASIGILGVGLVNDSSSNLSLSAHLVGTVSDPNNDGRLAFENTDHSPGELAQGGSLAGLVSFGFAPNAGSLHGALHLQVQAASTFTQLPAVDATITVDWPDISSGSPSINATGLPSVGNFLNMTPRDLAVGVAQLITSLTSIQRAKSKTDASFGNLNLPFLKGSLADAIQLNETLKKFLSDWTFPARATPISSRAWTTPPRPANRSSSRSSSSSTS